MSDQIVSVAEDLSIIAFICRAGALNVFGEAGVLLVDFLRRSFGD